ncbi:MAG: Vps62-related protein [Thiotrichales bacterium]|nr:Vps62-related protein [Thiotrichales bacterium]
MKIMKPAIICLLIFSVMSAHAEEKNLSSLETKKVCEFSLAWRDKGSGGKDDVALYTPRLPADYFMIGGYAQGNYNNVSQCVMAVRPSPGADKQETPLLIKPGKWQAIWLDKGTGANMDGSVWRAVSPHPDYVCIGDVGQTGYNAPRLPYYRCLHKCLVEEVPVSNYLWSDIGTGARKPVSIYTLRNSKGFFAQKNRNKPAQLFDIKYIPACSDDLDKVVTEPAPVSETGEWENPDAAGEPPAPQKSPDWVNPDEVKNRPAPPPRKRTNKEWVNPDEVY